MNACPRCGRPVPLGAAVFCAGCGTPIGASAPHPADRLPSTASPPAPPPSDARPARAIQPPSRGFVTVLGVLGFIALAGATSYKVVTHPGRVLPPVDAKVRAAPPPRGGESEEPDEGDPGPKQAQGPAKATEPTPPANGGGKAPPVAPTKTGADAKQPDAKKPDAKKPEPPKELGPPPSQGEIRGCIDKRKSKLRNCADEAAQRMEFPGGGTARARMNPTGKLTNVSVPGGGYFASCAGRVIRGLSCRAYKGDPIDVSYPLK